MTAADLPEAFQPRTTPPVCTVDPEKGCAGCDAWIEGANWRLKATDAPNLKRERDALQAAFHDHLTGSTIGLSDATARNIIASTLREARGEP